MYKNKNEKKLCENIGILQKWRIKDERKKEGQKEKKYDRNKRKSEKEGNLRKYDRRKRKKERRKDWKHDRNKRKKERRKKEKKKEK